MKTIRLLYPDYVSGGLDTYYFGANLMQYILPGNSNQKLIRVAVKAPNDKEKAVTDGITAEDEVLSSIQDAQHKLAVEQPDKIILRKFFSSLGVLFNRFLAAIAAF
jgi:arginase